VPASIGGHVRHPSGGDPPAALVFANPWTGLTELGGTVEEEVAVGPENQSLPRRAIRERVDASLALVGASPLARREPLQLSGGELQRVALASAVALDAPLLVLDEPTAQLDLDATRGFVEMLRALAARGHGVILVEQNLELVAHAASRVLVLADGAPLAEGPPAETLERWPPLDPRLGAPAHVSEHWSPAPLPSPPRIRSASDPLLRVSGVVAGYPGRHDVLNGISLDLPRGSTMAWLGRNGAGKSTLARTIMGLVPARSGSITLDGVRLDALPVEERARYVGLVFQDPGRQLFATSVLDEVLFGPRVLGLDAAAAREQAGEALDLLGLAGQAHAHPGDLSQQEQRLLAMAAALASRPRVLILDEPIAGQDDAGRARIARGVEYQRERGAVAIITHDTGFARRVCDSAVTIDGGRIVYQ
ncbi:MAG: ABC transporter ATP-binding protein, partial [Gemmatimonadaceae bacterium]